MKRVLIRLIGLAVLLSVLDGCASLPPYPIAANNPSLASVHANLSAHKNQIVSWGGVILGVEIKPSNTLITILAKPLDQDGEPLSSDRVNGRFLARFSGFRDPAVFSTGRKITLTGIISGSETHKIGDYPYLYPVVAVTHYRLWPKPVEYRERPDYLWYSPWYPWYPWYGYDYGYPATLPPSPTLSAPQKHR